MSQCGDIFFETIYFVTRFLSQNLTARYDQKNQAGTRSVAGTYRRLPGYFPEPPGHGGGQPPGAQQHSLYPADGTVHAAHGGQNGPAAACPGQGIRRRPPEGGGSKPGQEGVYAGGRPGCTPQTGTTAAAGCRHADQTGRPEKKRQFQRPRFTRHH